MSPQQTTLPFFGGGASAVTARADGGVAARQGDLRIVVAAVVRGRGPAGRLALLGERAGVRPTHRHRDIAARGHFFLGAALPPALDFTPACEHTRVGDRIADAHADCLVGAGRGSPLDDASSVPADRLPFVRDCAGKTRADADRREMGAGERGCDAPSPAGRLAVVIEDAAGAAIDADRSLRAGRRVRWRVLAPNRRPRPTR